MRLNRLSLRLRLTLLTAAVSGLLVIAIIYLLTSTAVNQMTRDSDEKIRLTNRVLSSTTQTWLDYHRRALEQLVTNPEIISMEPGRQRPQLELMARVHNHMYLVSTTDLNGMNIARSDGAQLTDYRDRLWFQSAISGVSPVFQSLIGRTSHLPALILSMPIRDNADRIVGVGMFASLLHELSSEVQATSIGKTGYAYVVDLQNRVIAHPIADYTATLRDFSSEPPIVALRQGYRGRFEYTDTDGRSWLSYVDALGNGWGIIVQQELNETLAPLTDFQYLALSVLVLGGLALFSLSFLTIRRALRPITALTDTATAIASGDLSRTAPAGREDEIGLLSRAFNTMTERLRWMISDLEMRISEKERAEESLRQSESKYRTLVNNVNIGVYRNTGGPQGRFIQANPALARIFGYDSVDEFMSTAVAVHYQDPEQRIEYMNEMNLSGFVKDWELALRKKDGTPIWCSCTANAQYKENGELDYIDGVLEDITERKRAEEAFRKLNEQLEQRVIERTSQLASANDELRQLTHQLEDAYKELQSAQSRVLQQEKMASIGQLAAGVAHEINNPMGFIMSNLGSLQRYTDRIAEFIKTITDSLEQKASEDKEHFAELYDRIMEQKAAMKLDYILPDLVDLIRESLEGAERVKRIVLDLKNFSRIDDMDLAMADINSGIESTITIVWNELKFKASLKKDLGIIPLTKCNMGQLNQVFMNLLVNAGQAIEIQGEINIRTWSDADTIFVEISDTGQGIPADKIDRIFDPFFTTKDVGKGTGLGLSIVYDIIKKHNGTIKVRSEVGKGTQFTLAIPIVT